ncbi:TIGR04283 family arsenosugar biosynthesis glycosyltransferase [Cognatishimia sp. SS12]|uniref:TIGR04283 family arsenosugar biosynthesis glycosyltransferase n=1 Tax=Cognatishimia sp. SS12 TaxID=2979465 RepID=UPI00232ABEAA|nr:TIGR04283 family arsenosugar biosynthesis glycosyltransferase [Cognatishimia sp. SS12]MDC0739670.1 TIGR04283 family arsenosugar biosynthesis glycosyltransferase [Cognatishimia sp. SS12]
MRAPVSVVIPTLNSELTLAPTLLALMEGLSAGLIREVVISDGGSSDATQRIAEDAGAVFVTGAPSRGGQLRRGAKAAEGDWLLFLHSDTLLSPGWADEVEAHLPSGQAAYGRLAFAGGGLRGRIVAGWANLRSRLFDLPYGDQGLLVPTSLYAQLGGYADIPLMEDVALARKLRGRLRPLNVVALTSAERYQKSGWMRRGSRNLWVLARYFAGVSPEELADSYRR